MDLTSVFLKHVALFVNFLPGLASLLSFWTLSIRVLHGNALSFFASLICLDSKPGNTKAGVQAFVKGHERLSLVYLLPYAPALNPTELV